MQDPDLKLISKAIDKGVWLLENGVPDFPKWSRTMVYAFGDEIRPELERIWSFAQEQLATTKGARANPDPEKPKPPVAEKASAPQNRRLRKLAVTGALALMACLIFAAAWTWGREWQARRTRTTSLTVDPKNLLLTNPAPARLAATVALKELEASAAKGGADAQYDLGVRYSKGDGVPLDQEQAVAWYHRAAEQGLAKAQASLGRCYEIGKGATQDYDQAVVWYRKAAERGDASGQNGLGVSYSSGRGVPQDFAAATAWYRKAAEQGNTNAQCNLGLCYVRGQGVPQDFAQSVEWFRKAADQGDARGQNCLGLSYARGQGVLQDYAEAAAWFRKSADQGYTNAQCNLV